MPKAGKVHEFEPPRMPTELLDAGTERRARVAVDSAPVMLWMAGADRRFDWFNAAWESFTGRSLDELRGDGWLGLVHLEDIERCAGIYTASFEARQPFTLDYRLLRHDGQYRWVLDHGMPRFDGQGALAGYTGSVVEIHERKQLEDRLAERSQSLRLAERRQGAFLATLSHELRNPLAPIANAASMLRSLETGNPTLVRLREILERQVDRLGHLVEDLIDVTRAAQGQISLVTEQVAVETLVRSAVAASADALSEAGHTLDVHIPEQRLFVKVDVTRLTQALANIIANAARFTPESSVISLEVRRAGGTAEITVRDPGQGIAAEFLPHVFELFAQQDPSLGRRPGGLGVGLTLARRIVLLHDGDIAAYSQGPGTGARFVVSLPLAGPDARRGAAVDVAPLSESYRVLIIENADDDREALRLQMEMWGNEVRVAGSARDGLRAAYAFRPQIVLCDVSAPEVNGFELLETLRETLAGQRTLFAAVTGNGHRDDEARALAVGYDSFLVKPLQAGSLVRLLRSYAAGGR